MIAPLPALCFGKIPAFGDFVRVQGSGQEVLVLDQWLEEGIYSSKRKLQHTWDQTFRKSPAYHILYHAPQTPFFLTGILSPSTDQSGRLFPFLTALRGTSADFPDAFAAHSPLLFAPFYERANAFFESLKPDTKLAEIEQFVHQHAFDVAKYAPIAQEKYLHYLHQTKQSVYWDQLFGDFDDIRRKLWWGELIYMTQLVRLKPYDYQTPVFIFPLSAKEETSFEAVFCINLLLRLLGNINIRPFLFWSLPNAEGSKRLLVFLQKPTPKQFDLLLHPQSDDETENIFLLGQTMNRTFFYAFDGLPSHKLFHINNPNSSLSALLQHIPDQF
jgi:type VI secretion system ImpM family protein